jgi:sialate O-acetylesterase
MKRYTFFSFVFLLSITLAAQVRLPSILASGMVLQRDTIVNIWGWAGAGEVVEVKASWLANKVVTSAGSDRTWSVSLPTGPAGGPHSMVISGTNSITLTNILFGEVWICSGQSNMEFTINWLGGWKNFKNVEKDLKKKNYSAIRLCKISTAPDSLPSDSCKASWTEANLATVADFSATGFFFGQALYNFLNVPVGLIATTIGGTPAEAWTSREALRADPELGFYLNSPNSDNWDCANASYLYNGMIHPLLKYRIKGAIWYQGESNRHDADLYRKLFSTMIGCWRDGWNQGDFPFYYVQIAPYNYMEFYNSAAYLREAQQQTQSVVNTGMAVTMDIGDTADIHPKNKQDVGLRLALLAMSHTYKRNDLAFSGPVFRRWDREGANAKVYFDHAEDGLICKGDQILSFELAGGNGVFYPSDAQIVGNTVLLRSNKVSDPKDIRFAFTDISSVNLFNKSGLPAAPFRTDSTPLLIRPLKITTENRGAAPGISFRLDCPDTTILIRYTLDGTDPGLLSELYTVPVGIERSATIKARVFREKTASPVIYKSIYRNHLATGKNIVADHPASKQYAGQPNALLNGLRGSVMFRDGQWQGYQQVDFIGTIDLAEPMRLKKITAGFLHDPGSWIFLPGNVKIYTSADGANFREAGEINSTHLQGIKDPFVKDYEWNLGTELDQPVRFVRIHAKNIGVCPAWHPGKGDKAWLFVDEIIME